MDQPIIVHNQMQFALLRQKFNSNMLVVYCDPKVHGHQTYSKVLRALAKARRAKPINLKPKEDGKARDQDIIYVLSTTKSMYAVNIAENKPQALFLKPDEDFVDLFQSYLPALERLEGLSKRDFIEKSLNADQEFAETPGMSEAAANKLQTLKMVFSPDRFLMSKVYREDDLESLFNPEKINGFVGEVLNGERPLFWESQIDKAPKYSQKIVGEDFEKRVYDNERDALVLIYHPIKSKNRGLKAKFENFARNADNELLVARCNGVNESAVYRAPAKLPALVYFRNQGGVKEAVEFPLTREHMVRASTDDDFERAMREFIASQK